MANPGTGFRSVNSLAIEMSFHLLEPIVNTVLTAPIASGMQIAAVASTNAMYPGALVVIDPNTNQQEIVIIISVGTGTMTAVFANSHSSGAVLLAPTFPTQALTDPFFTQSEILGYLARAQNEFLSRVPCIFALEQQNVSFGQIYQQAPCNMIEIERVAYCPALPPLAPPVYLQDPSGKIWQVAVDNIGQLSTTFVGPGVAPTFYALEDITITQQWQVAVDIFGELLTTAVTGSTTTTRLILIAPNLTPWFVQVTSGQLSTSIGAVDMPPLPFTRLYEKSQEEISMIYPNWRNESSTILRSWFEDRTGYYGWGVAPRPGSNFPVELLYSQRDSDTLQLTDGFLVPDLVIHIVKYKALEYCWSKDGEQRSPELAKYCAMRFERGVMAATRWLDGMLNTTQPQKRR